MSGRAKETVAMRAFAFRGNRLLLVAVLATSGLVASGPTALAVTVSLDLCAVSGTLAPLPTTDPAIQIPIWGFVAKGTAADCSDVQGTATLPGPVLSVDEGSDVTINVTNALPAGHAIRFEVPGITFAAGPTDAGDGLTVTRTFTAMSPGTYLYQSGGDAGRQAAMGLYGALIVRSPVAGRAYGSDDTTYDVEAPLVLSQVDPAFNAAPDTADLYRYRATWWLINGRSYPDTAPITAAAGQRVLLRYLNAGYDNTTMLLLGMHEQVLARDASLLNNPFSADAETIPAGATEDAIAVVPAGLPPSVNGFALYNRQVHVTNGTALLGGNPLTPNPDYSPGGMLTFIRP
jgi:FtsP/CotA-like multicopper oxidase with cupredoxin domain